ncbi:YkgJ family cysteine cluster protein [Ornithinibacillus halophilus]|uniref:Putative zinc-or iron-chelating domain-containing protein n=1 Tax=Ornithinibacillus halophilus TaxID=930117 RepID=A0A1M5IJ89_9BACI|nr:YkgJ family cysteine cluster protein [Ornithinibacillus halophilus]SHG28337.1 Putative zinc-or iron-chelating domain-containing protein [Ornithinibacillus halophilus]
MEKFLTLEAIEKKINHLQNVYEIDEDKFYEIVDVWLDHEGIIDEKLIGSYKELLQIVSDEISNMENTIDMTATCRMGCAFCCYFPIIVNGMEAKLMKKAIASFPSERKNQIEHHLKNYYEKYADKIDDIKDLDRETDEDFKLKYRKILIPCPLLNTDTNQCMAYEVRPIPCRTYMNYTDPEVCKDNFMPKETISFEFLYGEYMGALNEFMQILYEEGDTGFVEYPNDVYEHDYLINWFK